MKNAASSSDKAATTKQTPAKTTRKRKASAPTPEHVLRAALEPYVNLRRLQYLVAHEPEAIQHALLVEQPPPEVQAMMNVLAAVLRPPQGAQIEQTSDVAALLLMEMSQLTREELRVICLSRRHYIQTIKTVAYGNFNHVGVRQVELFHEAARRNSYAIIMVHNHPTGDPTPSPEDLYITRLAQEFGLRLGVKVLDHIVVGRGRWVSIAEQYPLVLREE